MSLYNTMCHPVRSLKNKRFPPSNVYKHSKSRFLGDNEPWDMIKPRRISKLEWEVEKGINKKCTAFYFILNIIVTRVFVKYKTTKSSESFFF